MRSHRIRLPQGRELSLSAPAVMGIVNVTPDSFSDGGRFFSTERAIAHGLDLVRDGAAIIDIGGESTRPGAVAVTADQEISRVIPVIRGLRERTSVPISVDTTKAEVAVAAVEAGASIVNDVWGFQGDPEMAFAVSRSGAAAVLMHNRGHDGVDPKLDIMAHVLAFLATSIDLAAHSGVERGRLIVDPGYGFGKSDPQNLTLIRSLPKLAVLGCPILLGVSRKSSIGRLAGVSATADRLPGSLAAALAGVAGGASILRAHDVAAHVQALHIWNATHPRGDVAVDAP